MKTLPRHNEDRQRFVHEVASVVNKNFDDNDHLVATFKVTQEVSHEDKEGTGGGWYSYDWVANKEGNPITDEMIRLKTIPTRLHKGLIEGEHQVHWPHCLELRWEKELFSEMGTKNWHHA